MAIFAGISMVEKNGNEPPEQVQTASAAAPAKPGQPTGWRKWAYRLLAMTLVPAVFLILLELLLHLCGYGYPAGFFLRRAIGGEEAVVENQDFVRNFFPPGVIRFPMTMAFPAVKPAGTYRIFILGESAAMGYPDTSYHFGRILQAMLRERYPNTRFEIVNTAIVGINSHLILPIVRDCTEHERDLFVIYMGNNEVIGPYGPSSIIPFSPSLTLCRASIQVKASRTGQLLGNLMRRGSGAAPVPQAMLTGLPADDPRLPAVYTHFASNLQDICAVGRQAGARVLVCTVASNVKDCAPFASVLATELTSEQTASWQKIVAEGIGLESALDHAGAVACYQRARDIDDTSADLHFRLARCLAALKKPEAHRHFVLARDKDALNSRADSRVNEIIRKTASNRQDQGVYLVDVERAFEKASADGSPGEDLFYEHVHMNFEGNYLLAHTVLEQIVHILPDSIRPRGEPATPFLSAKDCQERLPFTAWNLRKSLVHMVERANQPPFTNQLDHAARQERWRRELDQVSKRLEAGGVEEAMAAYRRAVERKEVDFVLHKDFALLLWERGRLDEAARHIHAALKQAPHDAVAHGVSAEILQKQGKLDEALASAAESVKLRPDNAIYYDLMARLLSQAGKPDQATAAFMQAAKLDPDNAVIQMNLGVALSLQRQTDRATAAFNKALRINPNLADAHHNLSRMCVNAGRLEAAQHHLQEAVRINPNHPFIQAELAGILAKQGKIAEAISHLDAALKLRPDWPEVAKAKEDLQLQQQKIP